MLEVGNICELELSKKIEEQGLLVFNIGNISAILHIDNLSNNQTLNRKMFELFDIGHEVTALVTGFNKEKNYFELSTKAFRNSLDNVLSYTKCKKIVENQLVKRRNQDKMFLLENRKILDRLRGDLASTGLTFLYELLQNASDHPNNENFEGELIVHFEVFNNYLLLKHNGALFTENNFISICGILYGEQENETGSNRIGYKGIGFKSVFRYTDNVYVRSGNFSFCFKKGKDGSSIPWEVMPIFQNEIQKIEEIPQFDFFNSPVAFAFEFPSEKHKSDVVQYLEELAQNPYLLIFLKNLRELKVTTPNNEHTFNRGLYKDKVGRERIELKIDGAVHSDWLMFSNTFTIEDEIIVNELADENNKSIPEHFRQFRKPQIDLIIPLGETENPINIFAYLPLSATKYQLDYIINGDFIPNLDRSNIIENLSYNLKLAQFAGELMLKACVSFASTSEYKKIKQIFPNFESENNQFKDNLQESFLKRVKESKIFPSYYDKVANCMTNILADYTEVYKVIPKALYNELTNTSGKPLNLDSGLLSEFVFLCDKLACNNIFNIEDLKDSLKSEPFQNWLKNHENSFSIISHFNSNNGLQELLKSEKVFLNSKNELVSSTSLYYDVPNEVSFLDINVLNSELYKLVKSNELSIKLLNFEPVAFFKKHILDKEEEVNSLLLKEDNLIAFWKFVYENWESIEKETEITNSLKKINILCKSKNNNELNSKPISQTYLSSNYNSTSNIEEVINAIGFTDANFISEKYIADNYKIENWRKIFKKSKAITDLQGVVIDLIPKLSTIDEQKHFEVGKQIFRYWKDNKDKETTLSNEQIKTVSENLKIKCLDGSLRKATECIISDHYTTNSTIDLLLPEIVFTNQISDEYEKRTNNVVDWNNFFKLIGCQSLLEKKDVFNAKVESLVQNQEEYREKHFNNLQALSELYKEKKDNNFSFDKLSELHLKTNTDEWLLPKKIHFSSIYKPKLDLQSDETVKDSYKFLSDDYKKNKIDKQLLAKLGVSTSFHFKVCEISRSEIPNEYRLEFEKLSNYIVQNATNYASQHRLVNHIELNYLELLENLHYAVFFWKEASMPNSIYHRFLFQETTYKMAFCSVLNENIVITYLKTKDCFPNQENELKRTTELFSYPLSTYIDDKKCLPKYDLTKIFSNDDETTSLEEVLGIQQNLTIKHCIKLLSENKVTLKEIEDLEIVNILSDYSPTVNEKEFLCLLNKNEEWKPLTELFISGNEEFQIEPNKQLHEIFHPLVSDFGIQELSQENLVLKFIPKEPVVSDDIKTSFIDKAKFIAFKIDSENYQEVETELIERINLLSFYEVETLEKVFPADNPIFRRELNIYTEENKIFYKGYWKTNLDVIVHLFELIQHDKIEKLWFENIINRWDDSKIIENLNENVGATPSEWEASPLNIIESSAKGFLDEVNEYIESMKEIEDIYDEEKVEDLKSILADYKEQPDGKRKSYNLLAKLKLCKLEKLNYDDSWEFNKVVSDNKKFFIHSARGSFAYIHPNEILQMRDDGFKMAIDYGTNDIRIYNTHSEIIELYQNYLMLYQGEPSEEEILNVCEDNRNKAKFHFLIVDKEKQTDDALAILNILNYESYD